MKKVMKKLFPYLDIVSMSKCYSQEGEDLVLKRLFHSSFTGKYLDIGANHPKRYSNTYLLYKKGWTGVAIDPNPELKKLWKKMRPYDKFINAGVSSTTESMNYFYFKDNALNTFSTEKAQEIVIKHGEDILLRTEKIVMQKLDNLVSNEKKFDLVTIDAEGMDETILKEIDFVRYGTQVVIVEATDLSIRNSIIEYLSSYSFELRSILYNSVIFVKKD